MTGSYERIVSELMLLGYWHATHHRKIVDWVVLDPLSVSELNGYYCSKLGLPGLQRTIKIFATVTSVPRRPVGRKSEKDEMMKKFYTE